MVRPKGECPAYCRAVLDMGRVIVTVVEAGGRDGRQGGLGDALGGPIVCDWLRMRMRMGWRRRMLPRAAGLGMGLGMVEVAEVAAVVEVVGVVEVGRMFPTLVRKLRHGPLCEAAVGCAVRVGVWTTRGGRVGSRLETRTRARELARAGGSRSPVRCCVW